MAIILTTPRLIVRKFIPADEHFILDLYRDELVTRYVTQRTDTETSAIFVDSIRNYEHHPGLGRWGVFDSVDDDFIGVCILKPADSDPTRIELGYVLAKKYWHLGLATELSMALVKYGLEQMKLTEICACTNNENTASQNVLIKSGFHREGNIFWHGSNLPFFRITDKTASF